MSGLSTGSFVQEDTERTEPKKPPTVAPLPRPTPSNDSAEQDAPAPVAQASHLFPQSPCAANQHLPPKGGPCRAATWRAAPSGANPARLRTNSTQRARGASRITTQLVPNRPLNAGSFCRRATKPTFTLGATQLLSSRHFRFTRIGTSSMGFRSNSSSVISVLPANSIHVPTAAISCNRGNTSVSTMAFSSAAMSLNSWALG